MKDTNARREYHIKPKFVFEIDTTSRLFFFLPTIYWQPWKYRYNGCCVICFCWLIFSFGFGIWERR